MKIKSLKALFCIAFEACTNSLAYNFPVLAQSSQIDKNNFFYQRYRYLGKYTPQSFLFNANLQEFSQRVCYLSNLQTLGKISLQECDEEIELLWQQLTQSFKALEIENKDVN